MVFLKNKNRSFKGQITLPFVLVISGIIIEITMASTVVAYFLASSGLSERLALRAYLAARSGVNDSILRVVRDKEYGASTQNYSFAVDRDGVSVSVSRVVSAPTNSYVYTVFSTGVAGARTIKLTANFSVHQTTGEVRLESITEILAS